MINYFDFEKPIEEIDNKINSLKENDTIDQNSIDRYERQKKILFEKIY